MKRFKQLKFSLYFICFAFSLSSFTFSGLVDRGYMVFYNNPSFCSDLTAFPIGVEISYIYPSFQQAEVEFENI